MKMVIRGTKNKWKTKQGWGNCKDHFSLTDVAARLGRTTLVAAEAELEIWKKMLKSHKLHGFEERLTKEVVEAHIRKWREQVRVNAIEPEGATRLSDAQLDLLQSVDVAAYWQRRYEKSGVEDVENEFDEGEPSEFGINYDSHEPKVKDSSKPRDGNISCSPPRYCGN